MTPRHLLPVVALLLLSGCSASTYPQLPPSDFDPEEPNAPSSSSTNTIDLGTAPSGTELSFDVPEGALGFQIVTTARVGNGDAIGIVELRDPSGTAIVPDFGSTRHHMVGAGVGIFAYPPVEDAAPAKLRAGRWKVKLGGESVTDPKNPKTSQVRPWSGSLRGVVNVQVAAGGAFKGGQLDLDLYIPSGLNVDDRTVDVTSAANDPGLRQRIDGVFALEARLYGIQRGAVRFHAIDASALTITSDAAVDAVNMLATAHGDRPSAQVIFTNSLEPDGAGNGEISGISNCLPGAIGVGGTKCSAVIVALRGPISEDATTIVHELGHFIGLEHTTELGGGTFDGLSDTPECRSSGKAELANCPDFPNLMFPTSIAHEERTVVVSATQARIMHASPLYRAVAR